MGLQLVHKVPTLGVQVSVVLPGARQSMVVGSDITQRSDHAKGGFGSPECLCTVSSHGSIVELPAFPFLVSVNGNVCLHA